MSTGSPLGRAGRVIPDQRGIDDDPAMPDRPPSVAWIHVAPVKSMALELLDRAFVGLDGLAGDRAFAVLDQQGRLVNGTRAGPLATVRPTWNPATSELSLALPDGTVAGGVVELGEPVKAFFTGGRRSAWAVAGPWSEALSLWTGRPLRLVAMTAGEGYDRGPTVTLLSTAALTELAIAGGSAEPLDRRRFRMTFGIDGVPPYAEDGWMGRTIRLGGVAVALAGNVGRCAVTTQDPDTGRRSWDTLAVLQRTRGHLSTSEPLAFGVWAEVVEPGEVAVGDPVRVP